MSGHLLAKRNLRILLQLPLFFHFSSAALGYRKFNAHCCLLRTILSNNLDEWHLVAANNTMLYFHYIHSNGTHLEAQQHPLKLHLSK